MIITDETFLRSKCVDVTSDEVGPLVELLENELNKSNRLGNSGIGLAAIQIGILKRIAIIRLDDKIINLVNCRVDKGYDCFKFAKEGCLSFPNKSEDTTRFKEIYVVNNMVYPHEFIATDLLSVACQHEIDHFDGVMFWDRVIKVKIGPNDKCPCGSKLKFKKCCGRK